MANLSIYQNLLKPPKSIQEYDDEHAARQVNMLGLKEKQNALASYERGLVDESATREAYAQSAGDQSKVLQTLKAKGLYKPAMSIEKAMLDTQKTTSDIDKTKADTYKQKQEGLQKALDMSRSFVQGVSNPAEAAMYLKGLYAHPDLGPIISSIKPLEAGLASLPQDPQDLERWKAMHMGMTADKLMAITMPKTDNTNMGGYHSMGATDQFTGKRIETGQVLNTQSPDNAETQVTSIANNTATNANSSANAKLVDSRIRSEGALSRGVQLRGQNMTDARTRENNEAARGKPFEVTDPSTGKPMLVQQDKQGNITPVSNYGPKISQVNNKPLPQNVVSQVQEARDNAASLERLKTGFKDNYAGKGVLGLGADMQLSGSAALGADRDSVEWWKNYKKQAELVERHAMFGASLTANEQASWRAADISPGMDARVIKTNLANREKLTKKVLNNTRQDLIDAGHSEQRVNAIANRSENKEQSALPDGWSVKER